MSMPTEGRSRVRDLPALVGRETEIAGWVTHHRSSGKVQFITVRDGTGVVQVVLREDQVDEPSWSASRELAQETAVVIGGLVTADARAPGGVEMRGRRLTVVGRSVDYPISPKEHGIDFLMEHRHLWVRAPRQAAVLRLRARVIHAIRAFLDDHGFVLADPPIITPAAAEGTTTLFGLDYFGEPAYLSQSGQLYMEALAMALGRVYSFGPTFRAEKSKTRRHLTEFWMVEPEIAFCGFEENLWWQEQLVAAVVADVAAHCRPELELLGRSLEALEQVVPPFPRLSYDEALDRLRAAGFPLTWGEDFGAPEETYLSRLYNRPVFIHRFPAALKAFYMQPDPHRPEVVLAADLLAPEGYGEIVGGSQRIDDAALLERRLAEHGLSPQTYSWYLDLRRYGSVPHSGFGLGVERLVAWIGGLEHLRETIPFARTLTRVWP
jgi:asparaginyl-tRNA synthetase